MNTCEGCGGQDILTRSHRIPQRLRRDLADDPENIDLMCIPCHLKVEAGRYEELMYGKIIAAYIQRMDERYFWLKSIKFELRTGKTLEEWISG